MEKDAWSDLTIEQADYADEMGHDLCDYPLDEVLPTCVCPGCGEDRVDWLEWSDDGDHVECTSCGAWYDPNEGEGDD